MEELKKQLVSFSKAEDIRREVGLLKKAGKRVGLVPTMGFLHEGHLSLVDLAYEHSDSVVVSIFVNPSQFNDSSDLDRYPRDLQSDLELLESRGVHAVFCPQVSEVYLEGFQSKISLSELSRGLEGEHRPGHFAGVTTVVGMLFNIVQPDIAVFGEKDFQQLRIIEQMVSDLHIPVKIVRAPLVREPDGLAMSSRNVLLDGADRKAALRLSSGLLKAREAFSLGEKSIPALLEIAREELRSLELEYIEIVNEQTLKPLQTLTDGPARIVIAARVGDIRLIDNMALL